MIVTFFFTLLDNGGFQPIEKFSYFHWLSFDYCTFFLINITKIYIKHLFKDTSWKIQCKLPPKTKRFCPLVLK